MLKKVNNNKELLLQGKIREASVPTIPIPYPIAPAVPQHIQSEVDEINALMRDAGLGDLTPPNMEEIEELMRIARLETPPRGMTLVAHSSLWRGRENWPTPCPQPLITGATRPQGSEGKAAKRLKPRSWDIRQQEGSAGLVEYPPHGEKQLRGRHSRHAHRMELYI